MYASFGHIHEIKADNSVCILRGILCTINVEIFVNILFINGIMIQCIMFLVNGKPPVSSSLQKFMTLYSVKKWCKKLKKWTFLLFRLFPLITGGVNYVNTRRNLLAQTGCMEADICWPCSIRAKCKSLLWSKQHQKRSVFLLAVNIKKSCSGRNAWKIIRICIAWASWTEKCSAFQFGRIIAGYDY